MEPVDNPSVFSFLEVFKTGEHILYLTETGDLWIKGTLTQNSDLRLKENISLLENALEKISFIRGIYFNIKGETSDKRQVGVIAQDVETVLPEAVSENLEGYKAVAYSRLTPLLIESIKELKAKHEEAINALKAQNEALEARISALEAVVQP